MLHKTVKNGRHGRHTGEMTAVDIPIGGDVQFAPGGYHALMCIAPSSAVKSRMSVEVTFGFADGSKVEALFAVKNAKGQ